MSEPGQLEYELGLAIILIVAAIAIITALGVWLGAKMIKAAPACPGVITVPTICVDRV